jgi:hypothetical protein
MLDCREVAYLKQNWLHSFYRLFRETLQMDQRLANRNSGFTTFAGESIFLICDLLLVINVICDFFCRSEYRILLSSHCSRHTEDSLLKPYKLQYVHCIQV